MCQYEQAEFLRLSRQKYRKKSPKRLVTQGDRTFFIKLHTLRKVYFIELHTLRNMGVVAGNRSLHFLFLCVVYYKQPFTLCVAYRVCRSSGILR